MSCKENQQQDKKSIPFGRPNIGEEEKKAVHDVLSNPVLVHGPKSEEFEAAFCRFTSAPGAATVSSCTAALHLAFFDLGIGPGDEVLVPALTHVATAHAVSVTGATPVFIDCDPDTGNIDVSKIEAAITGKTRAITVVHFIGIPVDMQSTLRIANLHSLPVIEDCALALGASTNGTHVGLQGDYGCFSFYPVKHITTGEGGMLISKRSETVDRIRRTRAFCVDRHHGQRGEFPGWYDVTGVGFNYRMSEIHAAIGLVQINKLTGFLESRRANFSTLEKHLSQIDGLRILNKQISSDKSSYYCMNIVFDHASRQLRNDRIRALNEEGVGTSIYYPQPVPMMKAYRGSSSEKNDFRNAVKLCDQSISLPVGPHLNQRDVERIADVLDNVVKKTS
jgi:perosamine synthetase